MSTVTLDDIDFQAISNLQDYCYAASRARGFHAATDDLKQAQSFVKTLRDGPARDFIERALTNAELDRFGNRLTLIIGESIEAHEEVRSGHAVTEEWTNQSPGKEGKPEGVPSELADALIRILDLAGEHKIDLGDVIRRKLAYNDTREAMHGRKF